MTDLNALIDAFERYTGKTLPPGEKLSDWADRAGVRMDELERYAERVEESGEDGESDDRLVDLELGEPQRVREGRPPAAWIAGQHDDCRHELLLLDTYLRGPSDRLGELPRAVAAKFGHVDHRLTGHGWSVGEVCKLPKGQGSRPVAVPPSGLWPNIVPTLRVYELLRASMGVPLALRGYRPPDYNRAVGGASQSVHMWYGALDVYAPVDHRTTLAETAASIYLAAKDGVWRGAARAMREDIEAIGSDIETLGLGIYGFPYASNIHIDTGYRRRVWGETPDWIRKVKTDA